MFVGCQRRVKLKVPVQRDLKAGSESASRTLFNGMVLYHRDLPHEVIESMCVFIRFCFTHFQNSLNFFQFSKILIFFKNRQNLKFLNFSSFVVV